MPLGFRRNILIIVLFTLLTVIFTWPLLLHVNSAIPGYGTTDESLAVISNLWITKYCALHKLDISKCDLQVYPFGMDFGNYAGSSYLWESIKNFINLLTNEIFAFNLLVILSFILSGWFTYLLVYYITKSNPAAILSGVIFAFSPYHFARAWQHLSLSQIQWLPLSLLSLLLLKDKPGKRSFLFMVIAFFFLASFNFYYAYFMAIATLAFISWYFLNKGAELKVKINFLLFVILAGIVVLILISPSLMEIYKEKSNISIDTPLSHNIIKRPFEDLFAQSARPLSYFLPVPVHPVLGGFSENFLGSSLYGESMTEHALYLGWIPLILAFIAFRRLRKERGLPAASRHSSEKERFYGGFFILLAIVAWLFSQPPWWNVLGFKIYMPSFFMYKLLPMFRAYCRFGIIVMLAIAVLAGLGLKFLLERFKNSKARVLATVFSCALVIFEFWNWPPYKIIDISKAPAAYQWLKAQAPDTVIAEYPLDSDSPNQMYKFYQTKHHKKIINGAIPGVYASKVARTIDRLSSPRTAGVLKWMGVKYVFVHIEEYKKTELIEWIEELNKIPKNPGLKLIGSFAAQECPAKGIICLQESGPIDIYEVTASPIKPEVKE